MTPYLQPSEYAAYGVTGATAPQIARACLAIDAALGASQGLLWSPDAPGQPGYMTNATPSSSYTLAAGVSAGVTALTFPGTRFPGTLAGAVIVLDRANPYLTEAVAITSASGDTLTVEATKFAHSAGCVAEFGLTVTEELPVSPCGTVQARSIPVARVLSVAGAYRPQRGLSSAYDPYFPLAYPQPAAGLPSP